MRLQISPTSQSAVWVIIMYKIYYIYKIDYIKSIDLVVLLFKVLIILSDQP